MDLFMSLPPMPEKKKSLWSQLESNTDPLASQATALIARPCLLRRPKTLIKAKNFFAHASV